MVSSKKMRGLIGFDDAVSLCVWQVAKRYWVYGGEIQADWNAEWKVTMDKPLADPNLFLNFAHLGALGDDLPEDAILRWVRKHGLLWLKESSEDRLSLDNQNPIALGEFREEARRAFDALTLFEDIRSENWDALRSRISRKRLDPPGRPGEGRFAQVYLDGLPIPVQHEVGRDLSDETVQVAAVNGLEWFVRVRLQAIKLGFDHFSGHPRPQEVYRPRLVVSIPDLYSAIWYQFALLMTDTRPIKYCVICDGPIPAPRRNRETCGDACRKVKSRRSKLRESSC